MTTALTGKINNWRNTGKKPSQHVRIFSIEQTNPTKICTFNDIFMLGLNDTNSYYKSSLSKEQLEVMVVELRKKVKNLQQRHRVHLDKMVDLENTVNHLRQCNLFNEERLRLLEMVSGSLRFS